MAAICEAGTYTMIRGRSTLVYLFLGLIVINGVVYFLEWREARSESQEASAAMVSALKHFSAKMEDNSRRLEAFLRGLKDDRERQARALERLSGAATTALGPHEPDIHDLVGDFPPGRSENSEEEVQALPPLPADVDPLALLRQASPRDLFKDPRFNPSGETPTQLQTLEIRSILVRARADLDILNSEATVDALRAAEKLEAEGVFVEFSPDEQLDNPHNVLTFATYEEDKSGRMFYFYPEEFPELYRKRDGQLESATNALRDIMGVLGHD